MYQLGVITLILPLDTSSIRLYSSFYLIAVRGRKAQDDLCQRRKLEGMGANKSKGAPQGAFFVVEFTKSEVLAFGVGLQK